MKLRQPPLPSCILRVLPPLILTRAQTILYLVDSSLYISLSKMALYCQGCLVISHFKYLLLVEAADAVAFLISLQQTPQGFVLSELDQWHVD